METTTNITYSPEEVAYAMLLAGFPPEEIPTGVAISTAESGRQSASPREALQTGERSRGPWQFNLDAHQAAISEEEARDLYTSTAYAYRLWQSSGWFPWSVYRNNSYTQYISLGQYAAAAVTSEGFTVENIMRNGFTPSTESPSNSTEMPSPSAQTVFEIVAGMSSRVPTISSPFPETLNIGKLGPWQITIPTDPTFRLALSAAAVLVLIIGIVIIGLAVSKQVKPSINIGGS